MAETVITNHLLVLHQVNFANWGTYAKALATAMHAKPSLAGHVGLVGLDDTYDPEIWLAARCASRKLSHRLVHS
jgi:hypothetical protein